MEAGARRRGNEMEGRTDDPVARQKAHIAAVRRLRAGAGSFPEARAGLEKLARYHLARVAALAEEICSGPRLPAQPETQGRLAAGA